jgi:hypothetical protein
MRYGKAFENLMLAERKITMITGSVHDQNCDQTLIPWTDNVQSSVSSFAPFGRKSNPSHHGLVERSPWPVFFGQKNIFVPIPSPDA